MVGNKKNNITYKKMLAISILLMICGILFSFLAMYSVIHESHKIGVQELEKERYYFIDPPEISGVYFINSSKLTISLYQNGVIELLVGDVKISILSNGNKTTKIIDLNRSVISILIYVVKAEGKLIMEYDYYITFSSRPFAWLAIPAAVFAILGTILASITSISLIATTTENRKHKL